MGCEKPRQTVNSKVIGCSMVMRIRTRSGSPRLMRMDWPRPRQTGCGKLKPMGYSTATGCWKGTLTAKR
jgi:hypothetical protein